MTLEIQAVVRGSLKPTAAILKALILLPLLVSVDESHADIDNQSTGANEPEDPAAQSATGLEPLEKVDAVEEVLVIGTYRRSLREALIEKRGASEILEALSAEDIGQLPDTSVAESLARLPGLSYTRNAFGANNLSIRGLGAVLTQVYQRF